MKPTTRKVRNIVSILLSVVMLLSMASLASAASTTDNTVETANDIIDRINDEYGTNIHALTVAELEKYGLSMDEKVTDHVIDLKAFEAELRYIAEVEIPQFEHDTKEAWGKSTQISQSATRIGESVTNYMNAPIVATKAINYATAGATAYTTTNYYGAKTWGSVVNVFCSADMYSSRWFMALYPSVTKTDGGRTLYWEGYGDYCAYIDGVQYYLYSGTQYAEMYVGNYT